MISFNAPEVFPLICKNPVFVFPEAVVSDGVVASVIVTAPLNWLAPVDVKKVPEEAEKSLAPDPEAVNPATTTIVVMLGDVENTIFVLVVPVVPAAEVKKLSFVTVVVKAVPPTLGRFDISISTVQTFVTRDPVEAIDPVIVRLLAPMAKSPPDTVNPVVAVDTVMLALPSKETPPMVRAVESLGALTTAKSAVVVGLVTVTLPSAEAIEVTLPDPPPPDDDGVELIHFPVED